MVASVLRVNQYLDTNGDGTGTKNANGDYSDATGSGVENFYYQATGFVDIYRMIVSVEDATAMWANRYGGLSPLTVGILVKIIDSDGITVLKDLTDLISVKANAQWGELCYDVDVKSWGTGNELLLVRWTFSAAGSPIRLNPGQSLRVVLNDNLTGLIDHKFMIQGEIKP